MSESVLTVPTAFADISQLSEGLADRVDEERIMLYGPAPVEDGQWVRFAVTLADGSPAIEGVGRAVASIDGGEERPEVARYDIVLDSIEFEGMSGVVYERILMVRSQAFADQPATGEVSLDDVEQIEEEQAVAAAEGFSDEATAVGGPDYEAEAQAVAYDAPAGDDPLAGDPAEAAAESEAAAFAAESDVAAYPEEPVAEPVHAPVGEYLDDPTAQSAEAEAAVAQADPLEESLDAEAAPVDYAAAGPAEQTSPEQWEQVPDEGVDAMQGYDEVGEVSAEGGSFQADAPDSGPSAPVPPSAPPPAPPTEPAGFHVEPMGSNGQVLHRPSRQQAWFPDAVAELEASASSGLFLYSGGLPIPAEPPRPDLDVSLRIAPAPRPAETSAEGESPAVGAAAAPEAPAAEADYGGATDEVDASEAMAHDAESDLSAPDPSFAYTDHDVTAPDQAAPPDDGSDDLGEALDLDAAVEPLPDSVPPDADFEDFDDRND